MTAHIRAHTCRVDEIERLRQSKGLSLDRLATKAGIHIKTLRRMLNGKRAFISNISAVADVLGTTATALIYDPHQINQDGTPSAIAGRFHLRVNLTGEIRDQSNIKNLADMPQVINEALSIRGINTVTNEINLNFSDNTGIIIVYIMSNDHTGHRAWYVLEINPDKYGLFQESIGKTGAVYLGDFGTVIASNYGDAVPAYVDSLIRKLYPTARLPAPPEPKIIRFSD